MKKRIRKKHHVGEFKQFGNVIVINSRGQIETADEILSIFENIIDDFSLTVAGGGFGRILLPQRKNNKYIPKLAAQVVLDVVMQKTPIEQMRFCVFVKGAKEVPQAALDAFKGTFADAKYDLHISESIDIWNNVTSDVRADKSL